MNLPKDPHHNRPEKDGCPYQDLYIYYLQGRLKPDQEMFRDNFIGNWEEENYSFLFFSSPAQREIEELLRTQPQLTYLDSFQMSYDQWQSEKFTALRHGQFCILPAWEALPDQDSNQGSSLDSHQDSHRDSHQGSHQGSRQGSSQGSSQGSETDKKIIFIDPGVVFGNGTHPTTGDCLDALELAFATKPPETVLDLGTGTGLLALAAARLGGKKILAVDLNPLAVKTAQNNVRLNELAAAVLVAQGRAENCIDFTADLVIANIHYDVMRELVRTKGFLLKRRFILSGLLRSEAKVLSEILAKLPVKVQKMWTHDGIWHTFYGGTTNAST